MTGTITLGTGCRLGSVHIMIKPSQKSNDPEQGISAPANHKSRVALPIRTPTMRQQRHNKVNSKIPRISQGMPRNFTAATQHENRPVNNRRPGNPVVLSKLGH